MYSPNKYYQPYTGSRRSSVTSEDRTEADGEVRELTSHRRASCRCCCSLAVITILSLAIISGIVVWVLSRGSDIATVDNIDRSDVTSLLDSQVITTTTTTTTSSTTTTTTTMTTSTSKLKSDKIIFPTKKPNEGFHETDIIQVTTQKAPRNTTLETRYTEIITKMKEMRRKNRLSSKRNYSLTPTSTASNDDFSEPSTEPSTFPKTDSKQNSSAPVDDKNVDISDNENEPEEVGKKNKLKVVTTEQVTGANITGTEGPERQSGVEDENIKLSKSLIFEDELTSAGTAQIRNERNQAKSDQLNNLHSDLLGKVVEKSDREKDMNTVKAETSSLSSVSAVKVISTSTIKLTSSTDVSTSSKKFFVYPQVPALKTYTVDPGAETFCK